ncbi:MAG: restriction endonuclease [Deltaproteobacteria bacterium]|nr:restriction endonuclease [Deltaproteobacteria bacterium]
MAKAKKSTDEAATDGAPKKKAPAKKAAAPKKKAAAPKKGRGKKSTEELPVSEEASAAEVIDAEILSETPVEAAPIAFEPADDDEEETVQEAPELSDEERELSAIYGDVSAPATAHGEFADAKTRDEDRPMMPEINAREERKNMWQERRDRRKQRQEERRMRREQRGGGGGGGGDRGGDRGDRGGEQRRHEQRPNEHRQGDHQQHRLQQPPQQHQQPPAQERRFEMPINGHEPEDGLARVGTPLGDAAATVFAQLRNGQPLPVRQLAAMMRKRSLVNQDPEQLWPQLKAELLGDERSYRTLGLRPRIVYRGRDLFAPGPVAMSQTAEAEAGVANALSKLATATHGALASRLRRASPQGFERIIHAYLVAAGYREIEWVKRVGGIAYASCTAPGISRTILISARSGDQPIDRRGIGELRVGVEAKDLVAGILFSATELSEDAERELERAGRSISVVCGDQLVATLINAGVGVVSSAAPLHYLDDALLDEILAG